jgi:hypothetical protein
MIKIIFQNLFEKRLKVIRLKAKGNQARGLSLKPLALSL